jgi:4-methylaminobutanoate oxidase (formaldehyde-forming)
MRVLNRICDNDVDVPIGKVVYTQWLNERGGIEADLTVTRDGDDRYFVVTAAATQVRDLAYLRDHIDESARAVATDVTSAYAVLSVMGPRSRELLRALTDDLLDNDAFPYGTSRQIDIGYAPVRATRMTYVGELGWELYIPTEFAAGVFDTVIEAGADFGLTLAGYHALNSLRMEKGYRHWGHDITPDDTPLESGLSFAVAWDKVGGFLGRDVLERQRQTGVGKRLTQFALDDPSRLMYHNEPIWRDGVIVGSITSGMYGHSVGASLGMGWVHAPDGTVADSEFVNDGSYEIEVAGERIPARASLPPWYDPRSARVRA